MIPKQNLQTIIIENQEILPPKDLIYRDVHQKRLWQLNAAKVIVGPRRAGKTYFLFQIMSELLKQGYKKEDFIYINFEDNRLLGFTHEDFEKILEAYREVFGKERKPIFFLDEIHNIEKWEYFVRRLVDQKYQVYVTGSNAKLLSEEYATSLGGRYVKIKILPFSFKEYVKTAGIKIERIRRLVIKEKWTLIKLFKEFLYFGGFPEIVFAKDKKSKKLLIESYYETAIYRDVVKRYNVSEPYLLEFVVKKIAENVSNPYTFSSIQKAAAKVGINTAVKTISAYYTYLTNAYLLIHVPAYRESFLQKEKERKTYLIDNAYFNLFYIKENLDKKLENFVATELLKKGYEIFYYRGKHEVDFIARKNNHTYAFQVTYSFENAQDREISALQEAMASIHIDKAYILTFNEYADIGDKRIHIVPAWVWALES